MRDLGVKRDYERDTKEADMRIVLKSGGIVIIGLALSGLTFMAVRGTQQKNAPAPAQVVSVAKPENGNRSAPNSSANLLLNGDFEDGFAEAKPDLPTPVGRISGMSATNWQDNSSWADIAVAYAADTNNSHGGKSCQRIVVSDKKNGQVQFLQRVKLRQGRNLHAGVWVRAEGALPVSLELRNPANVTKPYGQIAVTVGRDWQKLEVSGKLLKDDNTALMIVVQNPGTIWVDDATVSEVP